MSALGCAFDDQSMLESIQKYLNRSNYLIGVELGVVDWTAKRQEKTGKSLKRVAPDDEE